MLGHDHPGVLLDTAFPWWICLQSGFLSCGHRLFGHRRWGWHDPHVEYTLHKEQLWCEKFLAGCQVQGYSGKDALFESAMNFFQISSFLLENTFSLKWILLGITGCSRVFSIKFEIRKTEGPLYPNPLSPNSEFKIKALFRSSCFLMVRN